MPRRKSPARSSTSDRPRRGTPTLGVDLGATKVVSGLVAEDGKILRHSGRLEHLNGGPGSVIAAVVRSVTECLPQGLPRNLKVGVSVAAQVDPRTGVVAHAPNLGWRDVPLARQLGKELGARVVVINDARAAALAEWRYGAGRGASDMFLLTLGTGVGGSAVVDDRLLEGGRHALGEVGHMTIVVGGRRCHCPNTGCLEAYVGGWAIAERAREAVRRDSLAGRALVAHAGSVDEITAQTVFQVHRAGDALAGRIVRETEGFLADGAVGIVNAFNPARLVLAGGQLSGMPEFVSVVRTAVRARCQPPAASARVVRAGLGEDAALVGAARFARELASAR
jgi:glucokinase